MSNKHIKAGFCVKKGTRTFDAMYSEFRSYLMRLRKPVLARSERFRSDKLRESKREKKLNGIFKAKRRQEIFLSKIAG